MFLNIVKANELRNSLKLASGRKRTYDFSEVHVMYSLYEEWDVVILNDLGLFNHSDSML